jgi:hypothetical protein
MPRSSPHHTWRVFGHGESRLEHHMTDHVTNIRDGITDRIIDSHMGCLDRIYDEDHT